MLACQAPCECLNITTKELRRRNVMAVIGSSHKDIIAVLCAPGLETNTTLMSFAAVVLKACSLLQSGIALSSIARVRPGAHVW